VCGAAAAAPAVEDRVAGRFIPADYAAQRIEGLLGERMQANLKGRLLHVDDARLLKGFQQRPGEQAWIGEHAGKFLDGAASAWLYSEDAALRQKMDGIARGLVAAQLADGYLGTYPDDRRWTSWDVWVHKYDLIGLLRYHEITGDAAALAAARRIGDLLAATFGDSPGRRDIITAGEHVGMAATSILEPLVKLYRATGDARYLDLARYIVRSWEQPNGPHILSALRQTGCVFQTANGKAYEMMSNLVGLLELYRVTGETEFLEAPKTAWRDIAAHHLYITGGTSSSEHFIEEGRLPGGEINNVAEGCATFSWLQLTFHLLRLTGEPQYAQEIERTVYNQLLGAQDPANGGLCYFTPLIGKKSPTPGINCCVSSQPRAIAMIPQLAWGAMGEGVAIVLYTPGRAKVGDVEIQSSTAFPEDGRVTLVVRPAAKRRFPLYLRVPSWTDRFEARIGKDTLRGRPGEWLEVRREWTPGDAVEIRMAMSVHFVQGGPDYPGFTAVTRGPQVLALDARDNPGVPYLHRAAITGTRVEKTAAGRYQVAGVAVTRELAEKKLALTLSPFSEARTYRVWLAPKDRLSTAPVSVTAFERESVSRGGSFGYGSMVDERPETWIATARGGRRDSDSFQVQFSEPKTIQRIVYLHGKSFPDGGWFDDVPQAQIQRTRGAAWETVGNFADYAGGPAMKDGQPFEIRLASPVSALALRVIGRPHGFTSCAELQAY